MDGLTALLLLIVLAIVFAVVGVRLGMLAAKRIDRLQGANEEDRGDED